MLEAMGSFLHEEDVRRGCEEYLEALEEERRKIQVFQRELPLCLELITRTIESCKCRARNLFVEGKCEEEISSPAPVLEEFMPVRPSSSSESNQDQNRSSVVTSASEKGEVISLREKADWLHSAQLWNQSLSTSDEDTQSKKPIRVVAKKATGAFQPFCREKHAPLVTTSTTTDTHGTHSPVTVASTTDPPQPPAISLVEEASPPFESTAPAAGCGGSGGSSSGSAEREGLPRRKASRRCWSPELHRRFLDALQQLGGAHVATPKQIRELMKVHGLTNDEVKSHLQKYRLHARGSNPVRHSKNSTPQVPQFFLVGGILLQPHASCSVTAPPVKQTQAQEQRPQQSQKPLQIAEEERGSNEEGILREVSSDEEDGTTTKFFALSD